MPWKTRPHFRRRPPRLNPNTPMGFMKDEPELIPEESPPSKPGDRNVRRLSAREAQNIQETPWKQALFQKYGSIYKK